MKKTKLGFIGALAIACGIFFAGCEDPCKDVNCNSGECVEGSCLCNPGYEGSDCATAVNAKFDGMYNLTETCTSGADNYTVTVSPSSSDVSEANLTGLWAEAQATVMAHIETDGLEFHIERTALGTSGFDLECTTGTISADGATITMTYSIYATGGSMVVDQCTATLSRQ